MIPYSAFLVAIILLACSSSSKAFSRQSGSQPSFTRTLRTATELYARPIHKSRRDIFVASAATVLGVMTNAIAPPQAANAEEEKTIWLTGKAPKVPGQKPRDKGDTTGTRKDPKFLRSISDCKSQCETTPSPDGLARSKEDCLSDCQDICCTTYEQCTFAIVPRI